MTDLLYSEAEYGRPRSPNRNDVNDFHMSFGNRIHNLPRGSYGLDNYETHVWHNFLALYEHEIVARLTLQPDQWDLFDDCLPGSDLVQQLKDRALQYDATKDGIRTFAADLWRAIMAAKNKACYGAILKYIEKVDGELYQQLYVDRWVEGDPMGVVRICLHTHELMPLLDLDRTFQYLNFVARDLKYIYGPVQARYGRGEISSDYAKALIVRTLSVMHQCHIDHLLYVVAKTSAKGREFVDRIVPNFLIKYHKKTDFRNGQIHVIPVYVNGEDAVRLTHHREYGWPYMRNLLYQLPNAHLAPLMYDTTKAIPLCLRSYQYEMAYFATRGENTMIVSPTGSGKTLIAVHIMYHHIVDQRRLGQRVRIAFFVPTVPLVHQQADVIRKYLGPFCDIRELCGGEKTYHEIAFLLACSDIVVCTPQVIVNVISAAAIRNIVPGIDFFSMMIFDEAHHVDGEHPYSALMRFYFYEKYGDDIHPLKKMPVVHGFTASLGSDANPKSEMDVLMYMMQLCSHLDSQIIGRAVEFYDELREYVAQTTDDVCLITDNEDVKYADYKKKLSAIARSIEQAFLDLPGIKGVYDGMWKSNSTLADTHVYISWIKETREDHLPLATKLEASSLRMGRSYLDALEDIYEAFLCSQCFPVGYVYASNLTKIRRHFEAFPSDDSFVTELETKINALPRDIVPMLFTKLVELINLQFKANEDSRVIVFVPRRRYCEIGRKMIELMTGVPATYILSANVPAAADGISAMQQRENIRDFHCGKYKVLLATSVADEGIDIPKCNLVIKYNFVTDEIAHIQRKGRARHLASRSILLTGDQKISDHERENKRVANLIEAAQALLNSRTNRSIREQLVSSVHRYIAELRAHRRVEAVAAANMDNTKSFNILCKACGSQITTSQDVRRVGPSFFSFVNRDACVKPYKASKKALSEARYFFIGELFCVSRKPGTECNSSIGKVVIFNTSTIPTLACDKILFSEKSNADKCLVKRQWRSVMRDLFLPRRISLPELDALGKHWLSLVPEYEGPKMFEPSMAITLNNELIELVTTGSTRRLPVTVRSFIEKVLDKLGVD